MLIVDDSSLARKILIRALSTLGINPEHVYQAENGKQALTILENTWVDCVFLDINMPEMNGVEFCEKVRSSPELKDLRIVIVSTEGSEERIQYLKRLGIDGYVRKPLAPETLKEAIEAIFN